MRYPGYLLNPGDMFQVEPERVMYATGAPKVIEKEQDKEEETEEKQEVEETKQETEEEVVDIERDPRDVLKDLLSQSKSILSAPRAGLTAKRKQDLRAFTSAVKRMLGRSKSSTILTDSLEAQFQEIQTQLKLTRENKKEGKSSLPDAQEKDTEPEEETTQLTDLEYNQLFGALTEMQENPIDETKPYATPWVPRDYMSAFACIPRYLEVNHNICAAVYIRHPVARPGLGEVPTPFPESLSGTAFAWYLRRR